MESRQIILSLHIPYCVRPEKYIPHYYLTGTNEEKNKYMAALKREVISYEGELDGHEITAVRLCGGSSTVMSPDLLGDLLRTVRSRLPLARGAEVTFEAHPLTIGTPALTGIAAGAPNRVELMMRSGNDEELKNLECSFNSRHVQNSLLFFHRFHLNNVGITVNLGIPGQTDVSWHNTLHACVASMASHITIEPIKTPVLDTELQYARYQDGCRYLKEQGYLQYAAGLFCRPHHGSVYELQRMAGAETLSMGVGAVTIMDGYMVRNTNNLRLYVRHAGNFEKVTAEVLGTSDEFMMACYALGCLETTEGLWSELFAERFGTQIPEFLRKSISSGIEAGMIEEKDGHYAATQKGLFRSLYAPLLRLED